MRAKRRSVRRRQLCVDRLEELHGAHETSLLRQWQWHTGFPLKSTLELLSPRFDVVPHLRHPPARLFRSEIRWKWALAFSGIDVEPVVKANEKRNRKTVAWQLTSSLGDSDIFNDLVFITPAPAAVGAGRGWAKREGNKPVDAVWAYLLPNNGA